MPMVLEGLLGRKPKEEPSAAVQGEKEEEQELVKLRVQAGYYRKIIERYAALINENEEKTVPELKALVDRNNEAVQQVRKQVLEEVAAKKKALGTFTEGEPYNFDKDFLMAAEAAFTLVRSLRHVHPEVSASFWLAPKEILELEAADVFDKAILLCSLLKGLDAPATIMVLELENNLIHPVVVFQYGARDYVLDASQPHAALTTYTGALDEILQTFSYEGAKCLKKAYEFDNENYKEF